MPVIYTITRGGGGLVAKPFLTLCDPMDYSSTGSPVHGIFQARIQEWVAIPFSKGSSPPRDGTRVSCIAGGFFTDNHQESPYDYVHSFNF